jgi:hypothetical protein
LILNDDLHFGFHHFSKEIDEIYASFTLLFREVNETPVAVSGPIPNKKKPPASPSHALSLDGPRLVSKASVGAAHPLSSAFQRDIEAAASKRLFEKNRKKNDLIQM